MYLIYGESFRLIDDEIKKIIKDETNIVTMDLMIVSLEDVITEATFVSMFSEKKIIIVKNANFFASGKENESQIEKLYSYMENPISLTTIIFTTYEKIDMRKKITKLFKEKYKIVSVNNTSFDDLTNKIRNYVKSNKFTIDSETINFIMNCCLNNYDLIYNELNKIFLYYNKPQEILLDDVKKIVSRSLIDNNFKFVEAVIDKNMDKANKILEDLYSIKVDPISLIMLLAREYRLMYSVQILMSEGYRKNEVAKELGLQDWQVDKLLKTGSKYYKDDLVKYIKELAKIDFKIKSGNIDKFIALKTFLLNIE